MLYKCVDRAYRDICRALKFEDKATDEKKEQLKKNMYKVVKAKIDKNESLEGWAVIEKFAKDLKPKDMLKGKQISTGLMQKWVNMTFKYLWLLGYDCEEQKAGIPIDSYVMQKFKESGSLQKMDVNKYNRIQKDFKTSEKYINENRIWMERAIEEKSKKLEFYTD